MVAPLPALRRRVAPLPPRLQRRQRSGARRSHRSRSLITVHSSRSVYRRRGEQISGSRESFRARVHEGPPGFGCSVPGASCGMRQCKGYSAKTFGQKFGSRHAGSVKLCSRGGFSGSESSNPPTPASQCGLSYSISGRARTADIPRVRRACPRVCGAAYRGSQSVRHGRPD